MLTWLMQFPTWKSYIRYGKAICTYNTQPTYLRCNCPVGKKGILIKKSLSNNHQELVNIDNKGDIYDIYYNIKHEKKYF